MKIALLFPIVAILAAPAAPVAAARPAPASAVQQYVRARAADAAGLSELAAAGYASALTLSPEDEVLALRAYRQALSAGDRPLAVRAARLLDAKGVLPADGRLLLLTESVLASDWKAARLICDRIEEEGAYGFAVPVLRAWITFGAHDGDPLAALADTRKAGSFAATYVSEHRALLQVALGQRDEGIAAIRSFAAQGGGRGVRLRLAAAAVIARKDRAAALALLDGADGPLSAGRARIAAGKPIPGAVDSAATGIAELFARVAVDINRERVTPLALGLARLSTFLAPGNSETWLVTSELLSASDNYDQAIAVLAKVAPDDPYGEPARDARVVLLGKQGQNDAALAEALAAAKRPDAIAADWSRVGELYSQAKRPAEAADAFGKALALSDKSPDAGSRWTLMLLQGGALHEAGDWAQAKTVLTSAIALAPEQPALLNYLGYAQLERRENLREAEQLIERASKLSPDDAAITDSLGWTYYVRGDINRAIETLEKAVAAEPGEPTINEHLGDAYWSAGRRIDARYAWRAALVYAVEKDAMRIGRKLDFGLTTETAAP